MEPITMGLIAGGLGLTNMASNYLSGQQSWKKQKKMFAWQKAWEKEKMQKAVQWQMGDMKKAGINPLVAGITGGATGSGAPNPSAPNMQFGNIGNEFVSAFSNLRGVEQMDRQLDIMQQNADTEEIKGTAQAGKDIETTKWIEPQAKAEIQNKNTNTAKQTAEKQEIEANQELIQSKTEMQELQNAVQEIQTLVNTGKFGKAMAYIDRLAETGSNIVNVLSPLKSALANKNKKDIEEFITTYRNMNGNPVKHRRVTSR